MRKKANTFLGYFEILYYLNQKVVKLCRIDIDDAISINIFYRNKYIRLKIGGRN